MAECNSCGSFVSDDYARVFGDNDGVVHDCRHCPTTRGSDADEESDGRDDRVVLLRDVRGADADMSSGRTAASAESAGGNGSAESGPPGRSSGGAPTEPDTDREDGPPGGNGSGLGFGSLRSVFRTDSG